MTPSFAAGVETLEHDQQALAAVGVKQLLEALESLGEGVGEVARLRLAAPEAGRRSRFEIGETKPSRGDSQSLGIQPEERAHGGQDSEKLQ